MENRKNNTNAFDTNLEIIEKAEANIVPPYCVSSNHSVNFAWILLLSIFVIIVLAILSAGLFFKTISMMKNMETIYETTIDDSKEEVITANDTMVVAEKIAEEKPTAVSEAAEVTDIEAISLDDMQEESEEQEDVRVKKTNLYGMPMVASEYVEKLATVNNSVGEECANAIVGVSGIETKVTFYTNSEYTNLAFTLSCPDENIGYNDKFLFVIYANDDENQVLYQTTMSRTFKPQEVEIDVTDCDFITLYTRAKGCWHAGFVITDSELN